MEKLCHPPILKFLRCFASGLDIKILSFHNFISMGISIWFETNWSMNDSWKIKFYDCNYLDRIIKKWKINLSYKTLCYHIFLLLKIWRFHNCFYLIVDAGLGVELVSTTLLQVVFEVVDLSKAVGKAVKIALTSSVEMFSEGTEGTWENMKLFRYYSNGSLQSRKIVQYP